MKRIYLTLALAAAGLTAQAQTPCVDGMAGDFPCEEVTLLSHLSMDDIGGAPGLNDIWGWTDYEYCKEYALVGKENGTAFVDVTDPLNPCYLGTLPTQTFNSTWRDIKVYNDYAFIVSEAQDHGMQVFDLTRLRDVADVPTIFDADVHYNGFGNCHNIAINKETGYAYPIGTSSLSGGPHFINIQDPLNPTGEGGYDASGYTHDAQIVNYNGPDTEHVGSEIFLGFNGSNGLVIVDVSDKTDPELLSLTSYDNLEYTHQGWITADQQYLLLNDEIDETTFDFTTRTRVFDISDLDAPEEMSFFESSATSSDHNHYIKGDYIFQSNYTAGLRILDLSDIANDVINEVAYFDVHPEDNNNGYSGTWSNYPYFASGNVIMTHRQTGLFVLRPNDPAIREATDALYTPSCDGVVGEGESMTTLCSLVDALDELDQLQYEAYPNPASGMLSISAERPFSRIELIDITGKVVLSEQLSAGAQRQDLDLSDMAEGLYILRLDGLQSSSRSISVQR